jgi:hypothetical protein
MNSRKGAKEDAKAQRKTQIPLCGLASVFAPLREIFRANQLL